MIWFLSLYILFISLTSSVDPYLVLRLPASATQAQVLNQYNKLYAKVKAGKKRDIIRKMYNQAYRQITLSNIIGGDFVIRESKKTRDLGEKNSNKRDWENLGNQESGENKTEDNITESQKQNYETAKLIVNVGTPIAKVLFGLGVFWGVWKFSKGFRTERQI